MRAFRSTLQSNENFSASDVIARLAPLERST
jgi:hypothetical protein